MKKIVDVVEEFFLKLFEKIGLKKFVEWYRNHREGMRYLVFGALTTIVNIVMYWIAYYPLHISNEVSNAIAWIVSATFAYITNKYCVFDSKVSSLKALLYEIVTFYGFRLLSFGIDELIMIVTVNKLGWNALIMKIIVNIIIVVLNFVFSKLIIFKNNKK